MKSKYYFLILGILVVSYFVLGLAFAHNVIVVDKNSSTKSTSGLWASITSYFSKDKNTAAPAIDPHPLPAAEENRFDVLVMGIRGPEEADDTGRWLTDTMLLISINKTTGKTAMISIPRDIYLDMDVPEFENKFHLTGKINEVYVRGMAYNRGIDLAKIVVSKITGVHIDNAVVFDFKAFKDIVETLGGIDIHLDQPFSEKQQWGYEFSLPAGDNHLNGEQALYYARSRYSSSDFDRARRQQQIMDAIKKKAVSLGFLSSPSKITALFTSLRGDITTDFNIWGIKDILSLASSVTSGSAAITHYVLTTENHLNETHLDNGEYILLPKDGNFTQIKSFFQNIFNPPTPSPKPTTS